MIGDVLPQTIEEASCEAGVSASRGHADGSRRGLREGLRSMKVSPPLPNEGSTGVRTGTDRTPHK